ncbi:oligosaccharide flippase family protein [Listeria booriae]|uniref:Oligosaccharide flippase family protein n=1 Tax=Listeria booriae TaxID=1552123 RepID=A0A7X1CIN0_9LIST|nr:oligosaccharide flippase family protein [Listeria booriae]MBC1779159.1 oligosaccharide flippase family protein [Listeria booriae]
MGEDANKKRLVRNTIYLYILTFSSYFFSLITVPYQTRILGPEFYGKIGFSTALIAYFRLIIDFGFILSATADVSRHRENRQRVSMIYSHVFYAKCLLVLVSGVALFFLCLHVSFLRMDIGLYMLTFLSLVMQAMMPDFLYRGMENMRFITVRVLALQALFTGLIFIFLKEPSEYYFIPLFTLIGNVIGWFVVERHIRSKWQIKLQKMQYSQVYKTMKSSFPFFLSRIAGTMYQATNTLFIGWFYSPSSAIVGYYTGVDRLVGSAKSMFSPVADSLYPYMIKNRDFRLLRKWLLLIMPPTILGCILIGIFAKPLMSLLLGPAFYEAGSILRLLIPVVALMPLVYLLGFPVLSPMGLARHANISTIVSAAFQFCALGIIFVLGSFSITALCIITVCSQSLVVFYRAIIIWKHRKKFKERLLSKND